jgi:hypothetical protein
MLEASNKNDGTVDTRTWDDESGVGDAAVAEGGFDEEVDAVAMTVEVAEEGLDDPLLSRAGRLT